MSFIKNITNADFVDGVVEIPFSEHNVEFPQISVYEDRNGIYSEVMISKSFNRQFDVVLEAGRGFDALVVLK